MAKLTTKRRKALPSSIFALPKQRKYPVDTKNRAANAKARAQQQYDKGNLSKEELDKIDRKANVVIKRGGGNPKPISKKKEGNMTITSSYAVKARRK